MITFLSGMAAGAAALLALRKVWFVRGERMERYRRRRAERARRKAQERRGFCGDVGRDNDWMTQELPKL